MRLLVSLGVLYAAWYYLGWLGVGVCLFGAIPTGFFVVMHFTGFDVRKHGSRGSGATQVERILKEKMARAMGDEAEHFAHKWGRITMLLDIFKGLLPTGLAFWIGHDLKLSMELGFVAVAGHIFPIWLRGQGGKGAGAALGVLNPILPFRSI